jgi:phospholipase/carboxylesterase
MRIGGLDTLYRPATGGFTPRLLVMLHGLSGDEKVMWVFAHDLPTDFAILAPRACYPAPEGGYSWVEPSSSRAENTLADFERSIEALYTLIQNWEPARQQPGAQIHWMGFSQGAALAAAFALRYPEKVASLAMLAGFVPSLAEGANYSGLRGKRIFIAHGTRDERVSVSKARSASSIFSSAGAIVSYCEANTGHKLGAGCMRNLLDFYR